MYLKELFHVTTLRFSNKSERQTQSRFFKIRKMKSILIDAIYALDFSESLLQFNVKDINVVYIINITIVVFLHKLFHTK